MESIDKFLYPKIPKVEGVRSEDHVTFVTDYDSKLAFIEQWQAKNFSLLPTLETIQYPAEHIALVKNEKMVSFSVSKEPESPINRFVKLYGGYRLTGKGKLAPGKLQHVAYTVNPELVMDDIRTQLEDLGVKFMTPILSYSDKEGGSLSQMLVACKMPWGPFVEVIQRRGLNKSGIDSTSGQGYQGFNPKQIDNLYYFYDEYSKQLI